MHRSTSLDHSSDLQVLLQVGAQYEQENELKDAKALRVEIDKLHREIRDYQMSLLTSNEHGDLLEEHLYRLNTSLAAEIQERQAADDKIQKLMQAISREKCDLEVLVQILIDQGDDAAAEGEKARVDGLTQIANRRRFDEYLANEWGRHLHAQRVLSLLICDVDHFKLYNDRHGHQAGDECLKTVAKAIRDSCRADGLVARYGGEEFAIVLPGAGPKAAGLIAELLRSAVESAGVLHSTSPDRSGVTMSIGIASRTPGRHDASQLHLLVEEADRNLYLAKHRGRNRAVSSNEELTG